ncbi:MAG: hypothetical protein IKF72_04545 [Kiritimatiellae bacterium]|nr:hypothetical protein [Kiritimatiellia bacterium]
MEVLKENEEKRSRKEERENQQQQQRPATPSSCGPYKSAEDARRADLLNSAWNCGIVRRDLDDVAAKIGMDEAEVFDWLKYMDEVGWQMSNGQPVNAFNFRRPLRMWHKVQERIDGSKARREQNRREHRQRQEEANQLRRAQKVAADPAAWELCRERCANAKERGGCACGVACPPAHLPRPVPPQECPRFAAKGGGR